MKKFHLLYTSILLFLSGCAYSTHVHHVSDYNDNVSVQNSKVVESYAEKGIFLGFSLDNDFAQKAYKNLLAECPNGEISGIHTQFVTALGFLSYTQKVFMKGYCVNN